MVVFVGPDPVVVQCLGELCAHGFAHGVNARRVDHVELLGQVVLGRQGEHQLFECRVQLRVAQHGTQGVQAGRVQRFARWCAAGQNGVQGAAQRQALCCFPAVERVAVTGQQAEQLLVAVVEVEQHWGRESAQQRGQGFGVDVDESQALAGFGQHQGAAADCGAAFVRQLQRQFAPVGIEQTQSQRDHERFFRRRAGCGRAALRKRERVAARGGVVFAAGVQARRAGLAVPAHELRQQALQIAVRVGVGHRLGKVVAGDGAAVVALEIPFHAGGKAGTPDQGLHHAHHFGALFVHRDGVEVVDFCVAVGPHRVRHRAGIFRKLGGAQHAHVLDALDRARRRIGAQVHAEFLVAKDRQTFFQAELEPVAAGHAVTAPVVEVLVADHRLDVGEVGVGGGGAIGQHVLGVEDVEAFVLHRTHVEVGGGHDHEALQIECQAKARFVPGHAGDQRGHGVFGLVHVARSHINLQQVLAAVARRDALLARHQLAGHQGKQVAGFFMRIDPARKVAAVGQRALLDQVAVGQQHRVLGRVGAQRHAKAGHHVGAVQKVGDAAKTFGFTLGEKRALTDVQAHQMGVFFRRAGAENFQLERVVVGRQVFQHQLAAFDLERAACAIEQHARELQLFAVEPQRLRGLRGVAAQPHFVEHPGLGRVEIETQIDVVDQKSRGGVVLAVHHAGRVLTR